MRLGVSTRKGLGCVYAAVLGSACRSDGAASQISPPEPVGSASTGLETSLRDGRPTPGDAPEAGDPPGKGSSPCSPSMTFIPGGEFTSLQLERMVRLVGYDTRSRVDGFCLAIAEVSVAERYECCLAQACCNAEEAAKLREWVWQVDPRNATIPWFEASAVEAEAYCKFIGGRLPTLEEWLWAAWGGEEDREFPWGNEPFDETRDNVCDLDCLVQRHCSDGDRDDDDPVISLEECKEELVRNHAGPSDGYSGLAPVGSFPAGAARWGNRNMLGNVDEFATGRGGKYYSIGSHTYSSAFVARPDTWYLGDLSGTPDGAFGHYHGDGVRCAEDAAVSLD